MAAKSLWKKGLRYWFVRTQANYYLKLNKYKKAGAMFVRSIALAKKYQSKSEQAESYLEYGYLLNFLANRKAAKEQWNIAYQLYTESGAKFQASMCMNLLENIEKTNSTINLTPFWYMQDRLCFIWKVEAALSAIRHLNSLIEPEILLKKILDNAGELTGAERGLLFLYTEARNKNLMVRVFHNISEEELHLADFKPNWEVINRVEKEKKPLLMHNVCETKSVVCLPIIFKEKMQGIIYLDSSVAGCSFNDLDLVIIGILSDQAGILIENAKLCDKLQIYTQKMEKLNNKLTKWNQLLEQRGLEGDKQTKEKDWEADEMLKKLRNYTCAVEELAISKERNRFALDLHDTLGNTLTLLIKQLEASVIICKQNPLKTKEMLNEAIQVARAGFNELKRSVFKLMPHKLETNDLVNALKALFADFETSGMHIDFSIDGIYHFNDPTYALLIYKTCQVALTNSLQHGKAKKCTVLFHSTSEKIKLIIIDDGCGCKKIVKGVGLGGLEERVKELGGNLTFISDGKWGFTVRLEFVFKGENNNDQNNNCR
jgi:signal transduction histidine kinase